MTEDVNKVNYAGKMKKRSKPNLPEPMTEYSELTAVFEKYPDPVREQLLLLRGEILQTAVATPGVGQIVETLKWGQPSYLTVKPKSGTTIRLDAHDAEQGKVALFVHCQTSLIATFRQLYPDLAYDGTRAIVFDANAPLPLAPLRHCIRLALTYHRDKKKRGPTEGKNLL